MFSSYFTKLWALWVIGLGNEIKIFRKAFVGAATKKTGESLTWQCASLEVLTAVKCTLVQALRLCTGRTVHRGSRGIALPFLDHGSRRG